MSLLSLEKDFENFATEIFLRLVCKEKRKIRPRNNKFLDIVEYFDGFQKTVQRRSSAEEGRVIVDGYRRYNCRGWEAERTTPFFSTGFEYIAEEGKTITRRYSFKYDALGRIIETVTPDGRPSRTIYTPGIITRYDVSDTDNSPENVARGHFGTPHIEKYDALGRLLSISQQNIGGTNFVTRYTLDSMGRLLKVKDAREVETANYVYDLIGRKIQVNHVDAGNRRVAHNARGDLAFIIDAIGHNTEISYDKLGRRTQLKIDGTVTERYEYDTGVGSNLIGRLSRVEDEAGEVNFSYTPRGMISKKTRKVQSLNGLVDFTVQYAYDSMERMTQIIHPGGQSIDYHYNDRGLLKEIPGFVDNIEYNAVGQIIGVQYTNGVRESYVFDELTFYLKEARINGPTRTTPYYLMSYTYDSTGAPLTMTDGVTAAGHPSFQRHFTYDAINRLISVEANIEGVTSKKIYSFDEVGNFKFNQEYSSGEFYLFPNGSNRIRGTLFGGVETPLFNYDSNGNLISTPEMDLKFDARGRLARATKTNGTIVEYTYGYMGERVRKRVNKGGITHETIYIDQIFEVRDGQVTRFVFNRDTRIAAINDVVGTQFFHYDHLGNTVLISNATGGVTREFGYYPFGRIAFTVGSGSSPYQFIGNEIDEEIGLVYAHSRYYYPQLGRFISPDLFILLNPEKTLRLPESLNLYVYSANNPMRLVDKEGGWWKWLLGGLVIAALAVATIVVGVATVGTGFAFGILLAASIGSAVGSGIGVYSAWRGGGDLADGFLFGTLVGGVSGAAGYALGAAVGVAGISGVWGSILAGAAEGAIIGAGNGAIIGYAGGAGTWQDILKQAGIGFAIGLVLGGLAGYVSYKFPILKGNTFEEAIGSGSGKTVNPITGQSLSESYSTGLAPVGRLMDRTIPLLNRIIATTAQPMVYVSVGSVTHVTIYHDWDDIKAWIIETFGGEKKEVVIPGPEIKL
ncbi:MAG: RHS repeat-associated core domain-containing protein [Candidatus Bathyarchaeia archaeon]